MKLLGRSNVHKIHIDNSPTVEPLSEKAISAYTCPISLDIMIDPVITKQGYTFERSAVVKWLETHNTCPLTREPLNVSDLVPNKALRQTIENCRKIGQLPPAQPPTPRPSNGPSTWSVTGGGARSAFANVHYMTIYRPEEEQVNHHNTLGQLLRQAIRSLPVQPVTGTYESGPLDPVDIPENPNLEFLDESDRMMVRHAYQTVTRLNRWDYIRRYDPSRETGYMLDHDNVIAEIAGAINDDWPNHSGFSLAYTMRRIQYIAKHGLEKFRQDYCASN
jgi:hypothetical protein